MKYKHIIWDWNGTLLNDRHFCIDIMNNVLRRRGMAEMTEAWFLENFCFPVKTYYEKLGFDFEKEPFDVSGSEFINEYMERIHEPELHPEVPEVLQSVEDMGMGQSILSAASQPMLDGILKDHHIAPFFMRILGQDNHYAYGKEEIGRKWVNELHYGPHEILFVGDTLHDKEVADAIGADCALVSNGHVSQERLEKTQSPVFKNVNEIIASFENTVIKCLKKKKIF